MDKIRINQLSVAVHLGTGAYWPSSSKLPAPTAISKLQPVLLTLSIPRDITDIIASDDLTDDALDYSALASALINKLTGNHFGSLHDLLDQVFQVAFDEVRVATAQEIEVEATQLKTPLHAKSVGIRSRRLRDVTTSSNPTILAEHLLVNDLACNPIIGLNSHEREERQPVCINIRIQQSRAQCQNRLDFRALIRDVHSNVEKSSFKTLEALASFVADVTVSHVKTAGNDTVTVRAAKLVALINAQSAEIEVTRHGNVHDPITDVRDVMLASTTTALHTAAIALGSNLGDRFANIETALRLLEKPISVLSASSLDLQCPSDPEVAVIDTSFMYETAPMYVDEQPAFINCACMVETNLNPTNLLALMKAIEAAVGRAPSIRNGPRAVDLDLLLYDACILDTRPLSERIGFDNLSGELVVPHPRMTEREFVLRPLNDMIPNHVHPFFGKTMATLLADLLLSQKDPWPMRKVIPFPQYPLKQAPPNPSPSEAPVLPTASYWSFQPSNPKSSRTTRMMATLNATPDSFSDGREHNTIPTALVYAREAVAAGASIIDVGGYSTRPGADFVSADEEMARVIPIIKALRQEPHGVGDVLISVDTFRLDVAKAAIEAGANCLNDVRAFMGPSPYPETPEAWENLRAMRTLAREKAVAVVLMHSRGEASANKVYEYEGGVVEGVCKELGEKVEKVVKGKGGVRRWSVIIDPGIGFSKSVQDNVLLLRHVSSFANAPPSHPLFGFPRLIGVSRKSFLGSILAQNDPETKYVGRQTDPKERRWATAAAIAIAVHQGVEMVRVHDVLEMGDVVRVANLLSS